MTSTLRTINWNSVHHLNSCLPVGEVTHTPIEVNEILNAPDIENPPKIMTHCMTYQLYRWTKPNLSLENASTTDIPHLEQNLMSPLEFTLDKVVKLQKNNTFCKNILEDICCSKMTTTS